MNRQQIINGYKKENNRLTKENERLDNENKRLYQALHDMSNIVKRQAKGLTVEEFKKVEFFEGCDEVDEFINNCKK